MRRPRGPPPCGARPGCSPVRAGRSSRARSPRPDRRRAPCAARRGGRAGARCSWSWRRRRAPLPRSRPRRRRAISRVLPALVPCARDSTTRRLGDARPRPARVARWRGGPRPVQGRGSTRSRNGGRTMTDTADTTDGTPDVEQLPDEALDMFGILNDMTAPQQRYLAAIEAGGGGQAVEGLAVSFDRASSDHVLRHHELFSSRVDMKLGNVRPLIPLNVDPPQHSKYRKLLDPLFAPKRMDEQEEDITRRVNALIDGFVDNGECNFTEEFAELFPTSVFLGLMGLPEDEMRMFLHLRDGILHPEHHDPAALTDPEARAAVVNRTGKEIYDYFGPLIDARAK